MKSADFLSLHMPLTASTKGMFDKATFEKMKPGIRIVNVARGGVINDEALKEALDKGASQLRATAHSVIRYCRSGCAGCVRVRATIL